MKLHENNIPFEEIQKIVTNKKLKEGDLEIFEIHQEDKIILSFKDSVDINVNLSKEINEIKNHKKIHFMLSSNSTLIGGSDLKILAINNCRIEVMNNCQIWADSNCEIICHRNNNIDCEDNCEITIRKENNLIIGKNCQINFNGHGSSFEEDVKSWTIGENNRFFVGALEYFVNKKSQL